jgi:hypothetical protein
VVEEGAGLFVVSECVVVVVLVGAGVSTTVVHEVKSAAANASGVRIISFFIVEVVPSRTNRRRFLGQMYFGGRFPGGRRGNHRPAAAGLHTPTGAKDTVTQLRASF